MKASLSWRKDQILSRFAWFLLATFLIILIVLVSGCSNLSDTEDSYFSTSPEKLSVLDFDLKKESQRGIDLCDQLINILNSENKTSEEKREEALKIRDEKITTLSYLAQSYKELSEEDETPMAVFVWNAYLSLDEAYQLASDYETFDKPEIKEATLEKIDSARNDFQAAQKLFEQNEQTSGSTAE